MFSSLRSSLFIKVANHVVQALLNQKVMNQTMLTHKMKTKKKKSIYNYLSHNPIRRGCVLNKSYCVCMHACVCVCLCVIR